MAQTINPDYAFLLFRTGRLKEIRTVPTPANQPGK